MIAADAAVSTGVRRGWGWLLLAIAIVVADQITKSAIVAAFRDGAGLAITDFFSLILTYNTGAAFSFLATETGWQRWFFAAVAVAATALIVMLLRRGGSSVYCAGLALILGGALGNLWDRLIIGKVVDFLLFHYGQWAFPAFNVADSAITVGAALLILDSFRARRADPPKEG
ncbi:MAG: lipoprotein signal peptidase [Aromatoleum sp.]|nr:lipoprotein signal peptidase [Aromatoleum sp.]